MTKTMKKAVIAATIASSSATLEVSAKFESVFNTAPLGFGHKVTLEASPLNLSGNAITVGQEMPSVVLKTTGLSDVDVGQNTGKIRIYSVIASVDTPVCDEQLHNLSDFVDTFDDKDIEFYAISADTPFAQARFIKDAEINSKIVFLSDSMDHQFGANTGTQIAPIGLLTRTTIIVGKDNMIRYIQRVPELTTIPSLETAITTAKWLK